MTLARLCGTIEVDRGLDDAAGNLAEQIERELVDLGVVLHDRIVPGTKDIVDHLVVVASGVWIIDTNDDAGRVERRDVGGWAHDDRRLFVADRDRSDLVHDLGWQADAVQQLTEGLGLGAIPVHRVLCFTDAEWRCFARPFDVDEVLVIWPRKLISMMSDSGPLDAHSIRQLAIYMSRELRAA